MRCYNLLQAWYSRDTNDSGKRSLVFNPDYAVPGSRPLRIPCGKCIGCRSSHAMAWTVRCYHESLMHSENCFLTLTYDDENLPKDGSLDHRHVVLFFKRLRAAINPVKIRYFHAGEYGEKLQRPHYHVILFGYSFPDVEVVAQSDSRDYLYKCSPLLSRLWPFGFHVIGDCTEKSIAYTAMYVLKKMYGPSSEDYYGSRHPEYVTMSRKPGIGYEFYKKYLNDIYNIDKVIISNNRKYKVPRYYDKCLEKDDPERLLRIKSEREARGAEYWSPIEDLLQWHDTKIRKKVDLGLDVYRTLYFKEEKYYEEMRDEKLRSYEGKVTFGKLKHYDEE